MRVLPYATRAWTTPVKATHDKATRQKADLPRHALIIDTETTLDPTQRLLFGVFRHVVWRDATPLRRAGCDLLTEGLIYADDLTERDPEGFATLRQYAATRSVTVAWDANPSREPDWRLGLYSRTEFAERWWYWLGVPHDANPEPAVLVFFNAPFDISRLAAGAAPARRDMRGGFSFQVMANADGSRRSYRPDVVVKQIDSKRALKKNRAVEIGRSKIAEFAGHYLDLRTAVFALTGRSHSLASACDAYGLSAKTDHQPGVSDAAIDYCRNDVAITTELFTAVVNDFDSHPIDLQLTRAYSPASIAKSYLDAMGITPLLGPNGAGASTPACFLGAAMSAFYGGRAECRIRRTPVPIVLVDFTSMYPTVNALMGSWNLITAETIRILDSEENTQRIRELLDALDAAAMFDPAVWPELLTLVEIHPDDDVLPVRAMYRDGEWSIGLNHFTDAREGHWYSLAEVVASKILISRTPRILRAATLTPHGTATGLRGIHLRGAVTIDPYTDDFFVTVIEQRQIRKKQFGDEDPVQLFLKVLANSGSYGIYAELNAQDHPADVLLHPGTTNETPRKIRANRPEKPGTYCYPPLAACITAAARLMLTLLEHTVAAGGGSWAFCDTDSMAIVATVNGGELIACEGGPHTDANGRPAIRALSHAQVDAIRAQFNALNPYNCAIVPDLLKDEKRGMCVAISAKRYAIYCITDTGVKILKASEHGLGQLLDPTDPDAPVLKDDTGCRPWIKEVWIALITSITTSQPLALPAWADKAAHARVTISSPRLLKPFETWNRGKPYAEQIKPANFMVTATVDPLGLPPGVDRDRLRLVAAYTRTATAGAIWLNLYDPDAGPVEVTTDRSIDASRRVIIKTYAQVVAEYARHPEAKSLDHTGAPCRRGSRGLLQRDHITAHRHIVIGKEANRIEEVETGVLSPAEATTFYDDGQEAHLRQVVMPALAHLSGRQLASLVGCDYRTAHRLLAGQIRRTSFYKQLVNIAAELSAASPPIQVDRRGAAVPQAPTPIPVRDVPTPSGRGWQESPASTIPAQSAGSGCGSNQPDGQDLPG